MLMPCTRRDKTNRLLILFERSKELLKENKMRIYSSMEMISLQLEVAAMFRSQKEDRERNSQKDCIDYKKVLGSLDLEKKVSPQPFKLKLMLNLSSNIYFLFKIWTNRISNCSKRKLQSSEAAKFRRICRSLKERKRGYNRYFKCRIDRPLLSKSKT